MAVAQHTMRFGRLPDLRHTARFGEFRSDKALVRAAQGGKADAASALIERHYPRVYSFVSYLTNGRSNAEDLAQDVFTKALAALGTFNGQYQFEPWLLRIARNLVIDESRKNVHRPAPTDPQELPELEAVPYDADQVWNSMSQRFASSTVRNALSRMPLRQRTVLILREIEEMSYADIAQIIGTNVRGVEGTLRRAKARFRLEAAAAEGHEAEEAVCKRTLRLVALNSTAPETARHLKSCVHCRTKSSSILAADSLFAALTPLAMGSLGWREGVAQSVGSMSKTATHGAQGLLKGIKSGSGTHAAAAPLANALQMAGSLALAGAISFTSVAGYSQINQSRQETASFPAPAFARVFDAADSPLLQVAQSPEDRQSAAPAAKPAAPVPLPIQVPEPATLVASVLNLLAANFPPQVNLSQLPVNRQLELLSELPENALSQLAGSLNLANPPSDKAALLEIIRKALLEAPGTTPVIPSAPSATDPAPVPASGTSSADVLPAN